MSDRSLRKSTPQMQKKITTEKVMKMDLERRSMSSLGSKMNNI